ncbi:hypothetical protein UFOVP1130_22 [uncultured Caudovirales phage]|uniref:Uncharacterized protein n=1 Tax=uncultured Caudovirales phage TaxID=2100421 RepID=A0A6J5QKX2_9CAUD|nr:hypothetical protein UFOVP1130_22 [uncultured Caudovirales phage]
MEGHTMSTDKKIKRNYKCDACGDVLTLFVNPSVPPVHACKKQANRSVEFTEVQ